MSRTKKTPNCSTCGMTSWSETVLQGITAEQEAEAIQLPWYCPKYRSQTSHLRCSLTKLQMRESNIWELISKDHPCAVIWKTCSRSISCTSHDCPLTVTQGHLRDTFPLCSYNVPLYKIYRKWKENFITLPCQVLTTEVLLRRWLLLQISFPMECLLLHNYLSSKKITVNKILILRS